MIQVNGCSPLVQAFAAGLPQASPVVPETRMVIVTQCQPNGFTRDEAEMHLYTIQKAIVEEVIPAAGLRCRTSPY